MSFEEDKAGEKPEKDKLPEPKPAEPLPFSYEYVGDDWVVLRWKYPSPDPDFDHYEIYKSTSYNELGDLVTDRIETQLKNTYAVGGFLQTQLITSL